MKVWWIDENALTLQQIKAIKMRNVNYLEEQELELMDYTPTTPEEAHQRIEEAERGIANNKVVAHEYVIKHSYDLLAKYAG